MSNLFLDLNAVFFHQLLLFETFSLIFLIFIIKSNLTFFKNFSLDQLREGKKEREFFF